jgi:hypothetical protein
MIEFVVAVCGYRGAGKDAISDALCNAGFVKYKFASAMKTALSALFGLDEKRHMDGDLKETVIPDIGVSPRVLMQWFGTDVMQHGLKEIAPMVGRRFWSDRLKRELLELSKRQDVSKERVRVVISDLRFPHEIEMLRNTFGHSRVLIARVDRGGQVRGGKTDEHESEAGIDALDVDITVRNGGSLENLHRVSTGLFCVGDTYAHRTSDSKSALLVGVNSSHALFRHVGTHASPVVHSCVLQEWLRDWKFVGPPRPPEF